MKLKDSLKTFSKTFLTKVYMASIIFNIKAFLYRLIWFNRNEFITITVALSSNKKKRILWFANNLVIPVIIIYSPLLLTLVSKHFHKIEYSKSFYDLSITGALSLLGVNVIRTSSSLLSEKINENKIPPDFLRNVTGDIESARSKLRLWALMLTFIGGIAYFVQVGAFLDSKQTVITWYIIGILSVCAFSVFIGRIITVIQSNFTDNDKLIEIWMRLLNHKSEEEYTNLKNLAETGGL